MVFARHQRLFAWGLLAGGLLGVLAVVRLRPPKLFAPRVPQASVPWPRVAFTPAKSISLAPALTLETHAPPWEAVVSRAVAEALDERTAAARLLALLPTLPEEALASTAEEAIHRVRDGDYAGLASPVVTSPATHGAVESVLFADLLMRPNAVALPTLLAVARQPLHPYAPTARQNLALLLGHDWQDDWAAWQRSIEMELRTAQP